MSACESCIKRSRLLGLLSARIEHSHRDLHTLLELLELEDSTLIDAIGGRRREELAQLHAAPLAASQRPLASICAHRRRNRLGSQGAPGSAIGAPPATTIAAPPATAIAAPPATAISAPPATATNVDASLIDVHGASTSPAAVSVAGEIHLLEALLEGPVVSIVGARRSSSYGAEVASMLARQLSLCGVAVAASFDEGIAAAAHRGAIRAGRPSLAVLAGGIDVCKPAWLSPLWRQLHRGSCLLSQLPAGLRARRWTIRAREAMLVDLADLVIVVEAQQDDPALEAAHAGIAQGKLLAAVPGRISSPCSDGPHSLLSHGAALLRNAEDALDLLHVADRDGLCELHSQEQAPRLPQSLQTVLDRIGAGEDTLHLLTSGEDAAKTLLALGELEARGLVRRAQGGRYVACLSRGASHPISRYASTER